jgi:hypothetical protein
MTDWDELERKFWDIRAVRNEQSHVSGDARQRIEAIIADEIEAIEAPAQTAEIARRIVRELSDSDLEGVVGDWLEDGGRGM